MLFVVRRTWNMDIRAGTIGEVRKEYGAKDTEAK